MMHSVDKDHIPLTEEEPPKIEDHPIFIKGTWVVEISIRTSKQVLNK